MKKIKGEDDKFQMLAENALTGVYILRSSGFIYANPEIQKIFGYSFKEFINDLKPSDLAHKDDREKVKKNIEERLNGSVEKIHYTFKGIRKDNRIIFCEVLGKKIDIEGKPAIIGTLLDITENKKIEENLLKAKEEAEKANKLKTEFISQISHEIRSPLNNMLAYISLIKEEVEDKVPEELAVGFKIIDNSAFRLIKTIDQLLNLSKIQTGNYQINSEKLDLNEDILEDLIIEFFSQAREKKINLSFKSLINKKIVGDKYTVQQMFINLIDNAIKYTDIGEIKIKLYLNSKKKITVDITDTGIGIEKDFLPHIFDSFSQEEDVHERNYGGSGLGLSLVKKYAELNNASISVKSIKGKGTIFTIVF